VFVPWGGSSGYGNVSCYNQGNRREKTSGLPRKSFSEREPREEEQHIQETTRNTALAGGLPKGVQEGDVERKKKKKRDLVSKKSNLQFGKGDRDLGGGKREGGLSLRCESGPSGMEKILSLTDYH